MKQRPITRLREWLRIRRIKPNGNIIKEWEHNGWGDNVYFNDFEKRRVVGWLSVIPCEGDEYQARMMSGKIARFLVTSVERCSDPKDMFFLTVKDIGYVSSAPSPTPHLSRTKRSKSSFK